MVEWRDIPSLKGYQASSEGEIRGPDGVVRKLQQHRKGYQYLVVSYTAHRLICEAFHGEAPPGKGLALHGPDHNKKNIRPDNLRWGNDQENVDDCITSGRAAFPRGEDHGRAVLTNEDVRVARLRYDTSTESAKSIWRDIGEPKGVKFQAFWKMLKRITWKEEI